MFSTDVDLISWSSGALELPCSDTAEDCKSAVFSSEVLEYLLSNDGGSSGPFTPSRDKADTGPLEDLELPSLVKGSGPCTLSRHMFDSGCSEDSACLLLLFADNNLLSLFSTDLDVDLTLSEDLERFRLDFFEDSLRFFSTDLDLDL